MFALRVVLVAAISGAIISSSAQMGAAFVPPPVAVSFPSSALAAGLASATSPAAAAGTVTAGTTTFSGGIIATGGGSTLAAAGGAATAGVAGVGLGLGLGIGTGIASIFGLDTVGATKELLGIYPDVDFVPNQDASGTGVGWVGAPGFDGMTATCYPGGTPCNVSFTLTVNPVAYGADMATGSYVFQTGTNQTGAYGLAPTPEFVIWGLGVDINQDGSISDSERYCGGGGIGSADPLTSSWSANCTAKGGLDYIEVARTGVTRDVIGTFYPEGHQERPESDANPERRWENRIQCSGGSFALGQSALFTETDAQFPKIPSAQCPSGEIPSRIEIWETVPSDSSLDVQVYVYDVPPGILDIPANCWDGSCKLELLRTDVSPALRCFSDPATCLDWYVDPNKDSKYECHYNGIILPLAECRVYEPTFNRAAGRLLKTKDAQGVEKTIPAEKVPPHGSPRVNDPVPEIPPNSAPTIPPIPDNGCPPTFTLDNFITGYLVYKGVLCALQFVFVPSPESVDSIKTTFTGACDKVPISLMCDGIPWITTTINSATSTGDCTMVSIVDPTGTTEFDPLCKAGDLTQDTTGGQLIFNTVRIGLWIGAGFLLWHRVASSFGGKTANVA